MYLYFNECVNREASNSPASRPSPNGRPLSPSLCQSPCPPFRQPVSKQKSRLICGIRPRNFTSRQLEDRRTRWCRYQMRMAEGSGENLRILTIMRREPLRFTTRQTYEEHRRRRLSAVPPNTLSAVGASRGHTT